MKQTHTQAENNEIAMYGSTVAVIREMLNDVFTVEATPFAFAALLERVRIEHELTPVRKKRR